MYVKILAHFVSYLSPRIALNVCLCQIEYLTFAILISDTTRPLINCGTMLGFEVYVYDESS